MGSIRAEFALFLTGSPSLTRWHGGPPHGWSQPSFILVQLEKRKGTADLLTAVPTVLRTVPRARFVLIGADRRHCPGDRTHAEFLQDEFSPEVRDRILLAGRLPTNEVDAWLQKADVFVAPSLYESFGLVFLEAMRWGTPVVGTTAGAIPEIIEDGRSGLLVPPSNPQALAHAMVRLLRDRAFSQRLGEAGRARCIAHFSAERMADRMASLYSETISQCKRK